MLSVRLATPADKDEVVALVREMIPGVDAEARWRWMYEHGPALTWLAVEGDAVAGCTSFFPWRLWLDGKEIRGALGGDGYVRPAFRRRGIGGLLHEASRAAMLSHDIACMYGAPGEMNLTPLKHGGSRELGHVARWARPLKPRMLAPRFTARLEPMLRHDSRVDAVWAEARPALRLCSVRDAAFYTWRFLDAPGRHQLPYVVNDKGRPIAACALEATQDGRVMRIVDVFAVPSHFRTALRAITRHVSETSECETIELKLMALDGRKRHLWRVGFLERQSKPFLCMIPPGGDRRFLDPDRWFYGGADADVHSVNV